MNKFLKTLKQNNEQIDKQIQFLRIMKKKNSIMYKKIQRIAKNDNKKKIDLSIDSGILDANLKELNADEVDSFLQSLENTLDKAKPNVLQALSACIPCKTSIVSKIPNVLQAPSGCKGGCYVCAPRITSLASNIPKILDNRPDSYSKEDDLAATGSRPLKDEDQLSYDYWQHHESSEAEDKTSLSDSDSDDSDIEILNECPICKDKFDSYDYQLHIRTHIKKCREDLMNIANSLNKFD